MRFLKKRFLVPTLILSLLFLSAKDFAQTAPHITYTPSTAVLTQNTAMTAMTPTSSGVAAFSYGAGVGITGGNLDTPYGVAVDASGNVYVANYGLNKKNLGSISKYNASTNTWSTFATDSINNPSAIAIDASGNLYVLNYQRTNNGVGNNNGNAYVTEYNSSGTLMKTVVQGLGPATGIAINNSNGNLDVAEESANGGNGVVNEYTTSGALNFNLSNAAIPNPVNVATDNSGNIYVLDNTSKDVVKFSSTGGYLSTLPITGLTNPFGLYIDGSGNIYVSDSGTVTGTNSIKVYTSTGASLTTLSGLTDPEGMTTDNKGNLYVTDFTNNTLTKYQPTGGYFISGKLPPGLSFNYSTGTISGTPTTIFPLTTYTITAYNATGSSSTTVTLSSTGNASAPTISYMPSVQVITVGTLDTLKATTTNSPTNFSSSPALPSFVGFNTTTGDILVSNTGIPKNYTSPATIYTITAKNSSTGLTGTTTISLAFVADNYWTGKQDSLWTNKQNWSAKTVPGSTTLASIGVIKYDGPDPVITTADGAVSVGYLNLGAANSAKVTVKTGASLTVNNIFQVNTNATPTLAGPGTFNIIPAAYVSIIGTGNLTINPGTSFVLQSNITGSASVAQITSGIINGQVTVQRYMSAYRGYRLMSSPVYASTVGINNVYSINYLKGSVPLTGTNGVAGGFDKTGNPTLYLFRENLAPQYTTFLNSNFRGINNINTSPTYGMDDATYPTTNIPVGNGYLFYYRGSLHQSSLATLTTVGATPTTDTLATTGTLNQGTITVANWYTPSSTNLGFTTVSGSASVEGNNLIGNPYACSIDWDQYGSGIQETNIAPFCYQLVLAGQGAGNYNVYKAGSASKVGTQGNTNSNIIASGQGFFVFATGTGASMTFTELAKIPLSQNTGTNLYMAHAKNLASINTKDQFLRLQIEKDSINTDGIIVQFNDNAKASYNIMEDARYHQGTGVVSLSSLSSDNVPLAINQLPLSPKGDTIYLKTSVSAYGNYTLNMKTIQGIPQYYKVWLKDSFTKDSVNMRTTCSYSFTVTTDTNSYHSKRFSLVLSIDPSYTYKLISFNANKIDRKNEVELVWKTQNEQNFINFTVERSTDGGKTFDVVGGFPSTGEGQYSLIDQDPAKGINIYRLKQVDYNNNITYSSNVQVQMSDKDQVSVSCYPNPTAHDINLTIVPKKPGETSYTIRVTNSLGMTVRYAITKNTQWGDNISNLLNGTYLIQVVETKNNSVVGQTKFVKL